MVDDQDVRDQQVRDQQHDADRERGGARPGARSEPGAVDDATARSLEEELCRLPEISASRVVVDDTGRVAELHVLARPGKHAKQISRDVQSVALASFGLEVDRRVVSAAERVDIESAHIVRVGMHDVAVVTVIFVLPHGEQVMSGSALVRGHSEADAVARAVLDATNRRLTPLLA